MYKSKYDSHKKVFCEKVVSNTGAKVLEKYL